MVEESSSSSVEAHWVIGPFILSQPNQSDAVVVRKNSGILLGSLIEGKIKSLINNT